MSSEGFSDAEPSDADEVVVDSPADKLDFEQYAQRRLLISTSHGTPVTIGAYANIDADF